MVRKMKTIRKNVFETNSSSTHSVTIYNIRKDVPYDNPKLVENNILYPTRIDIYKPQKHSETEYNYETYDEKAAVVFCWILDLQEKPIQYGKFVLTDLMDMLVEDLKYDGYNLEGNQFSDIRLYDDEGFIEYKYFQKLKDGNVEGFIFDLVNLIEDKTKGIADARYPY